MSGARLYYSLLFATVILLCSAGVTLAATKVTLQGIALSESGSDLRKINIRINDVTVRGNTKGSFRATVEASDIYRVNLSAANHFPMIHTFSHYELEKLAVDEPFTLPAIRLVTKKPGRVMLAFAGDSMMGRRYSEPLEGEPVLIREKHKSKDTRALLKYMKPYFELADFASVNLETSVVKAKPEAVASKSVTYFSPYETLQAIRWAGVDYVSLGNNHVFDYLKAGLSETLAHLKRSSLGFSGAGLDEEEALTPYHTAVNGNALSFLGYVGWRGRFTPNQIAEADKGGAAYGSLANIERSVAQEVTDGRITVVQYHGGDEYEQEPTRLTEHRLKAAIAAGADLAIGHHSHVTQGYEIYQGKLIAYSLGNFLFDQYILATQPGALLYVWMDGEDFHRAEIMPMYIKGYIPTPATGAMRHYVLKRLATLSGRRDLSFAASGGHAVIVRQSESDTRPSESKLSKTVQKDQVLALSVVPWFASVLRVVAFDSGTAKYRLGNDILVRGDFECHAYFGVKDRSWFFSNDRSGITSERARSGIRSMKLVLDKKTATASAGMKKFDRVFTRSTPATISGTAYADGAMRLNVYLQGRPREMEVLTALENGPKQLLGAVKLSAGDWQDFAVDYNSPRDAAGFKSIRILFEAIAANDESKSSAKEPEQSLYLDDIAVVEWQTPFLNTGGDPMLPSPNTVSHIQILPKRANAQVSIVTGQL